MTNREAAIKIIRLLRKEGYRALLAGGCVRDMLLKRPAKDYDVVTDAVPEEVIRLFRRTIKVGAKFGVVMVMIGSQQVEVATFRTESGYADGRHPGKVEFSDAQADAQRRDFTINGMYYDPLAREVIDYVGGKTDLKKKIIRTIGHALDRFGEDYLRMLRAVRFATQLGFVIEPKTWKAVCGTAEKIKKISGERIAMEVEAILTNPNRGGGAKLFVESGLAETIFSGLGSDDAGFGVEVLGAFGKRCDFALALAALFAGCKTDAAIEECKILKLSNSHKKHLNYLLSHRGKLLNAEMSLAQLKILAGSAYYNDLYELQRGIQTAQGESLASLSIIRRRVKELQGKELRPKPLLDGHELKALGVQAGPMVGLVSEEMYIAQLSEQLHSAEDARHWVKKWLQRHKELE